MRHIRNCKFWKEYGRCKFGEYCSFKHSVISEVNTNLGSVIKNLESKLSELEEVLAAKEIEICEIKQKLESLENENYANKEADILTVVRKLEDRQSQLEQETYARCGDVEQNVRNLVDALSAVEDPQPNSCSVCIRSFGNHRSLQNHMRNKHQQHIT